MNNLLLWEVDVVVLAGHLGLPAHCVDELVQGSISASCRIQVMSIDIDTVGTGLLNLRSLFLRCNS